MELNNKLIEALSSCLVDGLPKVTTKNNFSVDRVTILYLWQAHAAMPVTGTLKKQLDEIIGGGAPILTFIADFLSERMRDNCEYDLDDTPKPLTELPPFNDVKALAKDIISALRELPRDYIIYTPLNVSLSDLYTKLDQPFSLSETVSIESSELLAKNGPSLSNPDANRNKRLVPTRNSLLAIGDKQPLSWKTNTAYIAIRTSGYIDEYGTSETFDAQMRLLKAFFGLAIVSGAVKVEKQFTPFTPLRSNHVVCRVPESGSPYAESMPGFHDELASISDAAMLAPIVTEDSNPLTQLAMRLNFIKWTLEEPVKYRRMLRAAEWLAESYAHNNSLLSYIQRTVCLEILLGDKSLSDDIGIGKLLGSRCAYLVGSDISEREQILADFPRIYQLRSKIVHEGVSRIPAGEWQFADKLRALCSKVLWKELELVRKEGIERRTA